MKYNVKLQNGDIWGVILKIDGLSKAQQEQLFEATKSNINDLNEFMNIILYESEGNVNIYSELEVQIKEIANDIGINIIE
ncbi:MAG: hypothetical protein WC783_00925 [Candidatus Paceibacterota bacterium]|jgi:hypothetical protein